jgi:putative Holliday junction resolvase
VVEHGVVEVVVGLPTTLRGMEGSAVEAARAYGAALATLIAPVPVVYVDERLTTVTADRVLAEAGVKGKARRAVVDQVAATRILQNRLDQLAARRQR